MNTLQNLKRDIQDNASVLESVNTMLPEHLRLSNRKEWAALRQRIDNPLAEPRDGDPLLTVTFEKVLAIREYSRDLWNIAQNAHNDLVFAFAAYQLLAGMDELSPEVA